MAQKKKYIYLAFFTFISLPGHSQHLMGAEISPFAFDIKQNNKQVEVSPSLSVHYTFINQKNGVGGNIQYSTVLRADKNILNSIDFRLQKQIYKKFRHKLILGAGIKLFFPDDAKEHTFKYGTFYLDRWFSPALTYFYTFKVKRRKQKPFLIKIQLAQAGTTSYGIYFGLTKYLKEFKGKSDCDCPQFIHH